MIDDKKEKEQETLYNRDHVTFMLGIFTSMLHRAGAISFTGDITVHQEVLSDFWKEYDTLSTIKRDKV